MTTNNIKARFVELAVKYAGEYASRSMTRILDALPQGADRSAAELIIRQLYIVNGEQFANAYGQVFDKHLKTQFIAKPGQQSLLICFSGPFGAGKTTTQNLLDSGEFPRGLSNLEAVRLYLAAKPFKFEFLWAWQATGLYDATNHQGTFPYCRAAGAGSKDAAMQLAVEEGLDLLYPSSLTPHASDGVETLRSELDRLQGYKDQGYRLVILGCAATKKTCLERVSQRDRKPTEAEVVKSAEGFSQNFKRFSEISDECVLLDTGVDGDYSIIAKKTQFGLEIIDPDKWSYFKTLA
jgi:hypothetical protein